MYYREGQVVDRPKQRHRKRNLGIIFGVVLVVIVAAKVITAPVQGHRISVDHTIKQPQKITAKVAPASTIQNPYFKLSLPVGYSQQAASTTVQGILLTQTILKTSAQGSEIITVTLTNLPAGGLDEVSSYHLRTSTPQTYKVTSQTLNGQAITLATRIDGQSGEVVAFYPHGALLATLSLTTGLDDNVGDQEQVTNQTSLETLLANWQWQ